MGGNGTPTGTTRTAAECTAARTATATDGIYPTPVNGKWYPPPPSLILSLMSTQHRPSPNTPKHTHVCAW